MPGIQCPPGGGPPTGVSGRPRCRTGNSKGQIKMEGPISPRYLAKVPCQGTSSTLPRCQWDPEGPPHPTYLGVDLGGEGPLARLGGRWGPSLRPRVQGGVVGYHLQGPTLPRYLGTVPWQGGTLHFDLAFTPSQATLRGPPGAGPPGGSPGVRLRVPWTEEHHRT
jgi:hypothetical protein